MRNFYEVIVSRRVMSEAILAFKSTQEGKMIRKNDELLAIYLRNEVPDGLFHGQELPLECAPIDLIWLEFSAPKS